MRIEPDFAEYHRLFADTYHEANYGNSLSSHFMRLSHAAAERAFPADKRFSRVLELGAGSGVHLGFVRHEFDEYVLTDGSKEMLQQLQGVAANDGCASKIVVQIQDAVHPDFPEASFDRLIATHLLEHLLEPHQVLRRWNALLKPGGVMTLLLPCDPGMAWRFGRMLGPRRSAEKAGIPYDYWMAREHVNSIHNLIAMVRYYFEDVQESWHPLRFPSTDFNLFYICHIRKP